MKKNVSFWLFALSTMILAVVWACSDDGKKGEAPPGPAPEVPDVVMKNATVYGLVKDIDGVLLSGVKVTTGTLSAITDANGAFRFESMGTVNNRTLFRFEKAGYFTVTRSGTSSEEITLEVVMHEKGNSDISTSATFEANSGRLLTVGDMKVDIPAAKVVKSDGTAYTGTVNADMLYLDPNNETFNEMMPGGDLAAVRTDNSEVQLVSWGMVEVSLTDGSGNALQLKEDGTSVMTFPIPEGMESNPPETIPLWYFNEETGMWVEEGVARLEGNVYVGEVNHFSWHNLDWPEDRVTVKGTVTNCNGPVKNIKVTVDQTYAYTNSRGEYEVYIPANTSVTVRILSEDYGLLPGVAHELPGQAGGTTVTRNLELQCPRSVTGKIVNSCGEIPVAFINCEYDHEGRTCTMMPVKTDREGRFKLNAPNINGSVVLRFTLSTGTTFIRNVTLTGTDITLPDIEVCEEGGGEENTMLIVKEEGESVRVNFAPENIQMMWSDTVLMVVCSESDDESCLLTINGFNGNNGSYRGNITIAKGTFVLQAEGITVDVVLQTDGKYAFDVSGTGEYVEVNGSSYTEGTAQIFGKIVASLSLRIEVLRDVENWEDTQLGEDFPELFTPVDALVRFSGQTLQTTTALGYINRPLSDYTEVKSRLADAGFSIRVNEVQEEGCYAIVYQKGNTVVGVGYDPNGDEVDGWDEERFTLLIYVGTVDETTAVTDIHNSYRTLHSKIQKAIQACKQK